ncbi:MAG: hypothetical protein DA408_18030 [Bacteroidetes bacterium]|nr:MAG: hypothetical protein DA408_18030 [Bacteroidota bacterium]
MKKMFYLLSIIALASTCLITSCTTEPSNTENTDDLTGVVFKNTDNTVYVRLAAEPDRLNPLLSTSGYSRPVWEQLFLPLLDIDPKTLDFVPFLVKARPVIAEITEGPNAGGVTYTYELRGDARWSDGQPVTVADIVFTFKIIFNANIAETAPQRVPYNALVDIQADPNQKQRFTVVTKEKYILGEAAYNSINIFPAHVFDPSGLMKNYALADLIANGEVLAKELPLQQFAEQFVSAPYSRDPAKLIGTGPYRLGQWEEGRYITMSRDHQWWADASKGGHPYLHAYPDSLVFRIIPDQTTAIAAIKDELVDVATEIDAQDFVALRENDFAKAHFNFFTPNILGFFFIAINTKNPRLTDKHVRRALAHLVDVQVVIDRVYGGFATPLPGPVSPSKPYFAKDLPLIAFNIEEAKKLLADAGWADANGDGILDKTIDGQRVAFTLEYLVTPGSKFANTLAELFKDNAAQVGIAVTIVPREFRTMLGEDVANRTFQLYAAGASADPLLDDFKQLWHTSSNTPSGSNRVQFGNAQTDALIDEIRVTLDEDKRNAMYREFQQLLYDEQPMIFLFAPQNRIAISKRFLAEGMELRPGFQVRNFVLRKLQ